MTSTTTSASTPAAVVPASPSSSRRIPELDGLRGLAVLGVVLFHYFSSSNFGARGTALGYFVKIFGLGWTGVDLFFILSGFLIGGILLETRESPRFFRTFYLRRVHRILPIYFLLIFTYAVMVSLPARWFPAVLDVGGSSLAVVPGYLFFVQNFYFETQYFQGIFFSVTWSLALEEQFYLAAPPLVRFLSRRLLKRAVIATIVLAPLLRCLLFVQANDWHYLAVQEMPSRADELALGVGCAILWGTPGFREYLAQHQKLLYRAFFASALAIVALLWWFLHPSSIVTVSIGYTVLAVFYATLMLVVLTDTPGLLARFTRLKILRDLGEISYCVYLIHVLVLFFCFGFLLHTEPRIYDWRGLAVTLLAFVLTMVLAKLSWRYYERPMVRRGHRYSY